MIRFCLPSALIYQPTETKISTDLICVTELGDGILITDAKMLEILFIVQLECSKLKLAYRSSVWNKHTVYIISSIIM